MTRLVLVRHGETEGQSSVRYHGRTDVPLSALGREQMARARHALGKQRFDAVYASTLSRSVEAAVIIAAPSQAWSDHSNLANGLRIHTVEA